MADKGHTELPWFLRQAGKTSPTGEPYDWIADHPGQGMHRAIIVARGSCSPADMAFIVTAVNTYPAVEGLVKALEGVERGCTAVLLDAALSDAPEGFDECPINPDVLEQIVKDVRVALSRFRSLQNGGAND